MTEASGAVVVEKYAFLAGVRAGLEAAAAAIGEHLERFGTFMTPTERGGYHKSLALIRALDPTSVSAAGALREKGE